MQNETETLFPRSCPVAGHLLLCLNRYSVKSKMRVVSSFLREHTCAHVLHTLDALSAALDKIQIVSRNDKNIVRKHGMSVVYLHY